MDQRIELFLADVLALAGEEPDVVRDEVRVALGDYARSSGRKNRTTSLKTKPLAAAACYAQLWRAGATPKILVAPVRPLHAFTAEFLRRSNSTDLFRASATKGEAQRRGPRLRCSEIPPRDQSSRPRGR